MVRRLTAEKAREAGLDLYEFRTGTKDRATIKADWGVEPETLHAAIRKATREAR